MKKIAIFGLVDKRPVVYPLLRVMSFMGKVKVITDDRSFMLFSDNNEEEFQLNQIDFEIKSDITQDDYNKSYVNSLYECVLFVTKTEIPTEVLEQIDKVVLMRLVDRPYVSLEKLDEMELVLDDKFVQVYLTYEKVDKKYKKIAPSEKLVKYLTDCEERKWFVNMKESQQAANLKELFGEELKLSKEAITKLLKREW